MLKLSLNEMLIKPFDRYDDHFNYKKFYMYANVTIENVLTLVINDTSKKTNNNSTTTDNHSTLSSFNIN